MLLYWVHFCEEKTFETKQKNQIDKEVKLSLFADNLILYIENPKDSTKILLEVTNPVKYQNTKSIYKNVSRVCIH